MPYKKLQDQQKHNRKYYVNNRKNILSKRKLRVEKNREDWRKWYQKKKDLERKEKIKSGQIYKPKVF